MILPAHQGSSPGARIISEFISGFSTMRFQWEERISDDALSVKGEDF